jgi:lipopolysaccharide transport system permease protein/teichoic acid transport system permease protein
LHLLSEIAYFIKDIVKNRAVFKSLVVNDFKQRYLGSYLGILWAFIQPLITVLIFWFVFQVGFKAQPVSDVPFILWLVAGMFPWFFFAEALSNATNAIMENAYLVKKVVFKVAFLPIIKIISALLVHLFFIGLLYLLFLLYGYGFSLYWLQIFYYLFATIVLVLGISYFTSSVVVFFRDMGQLVAMLLQFGFWMTPIFWSIEIIPAKYQWFLKLNPLYYIVEGYRDSMIHHVWFWERPLLTLYFWVVALGMLWLGFSTFRRLKPHFADVL